MNDLSLTQQQRFPLLDEAGHQMLQRLLQHPHAPRFNYPCGERLNVQGLESVREYARELKSGRNGWGHREVPHWLEDFVRLCRSEVAFYRDRSDWPADFFALPFTTRDDVRQQPWSFVPDSADISELIVYRTSGTTGNLLNIISHPVAPNRYLPLLEKAVSRQGVKIEGGDRVSIIQVASQARTYTLASVMSYFDSAGFAKVNLNPADWTDPEDRRRFLDDCNAEIYTGDPFAFVELARLNLTTRPKALVSSATTMLKGEQEYLQSRFGCPVIDMYALNESGPVACGCGETMEILPHDLYVEIIDPRGRPCDPGEHGEIVVTGGVNPNLPLIRYRTGDYAAMDFSTPLPQLRQFAGRKPVLYVTTDGALLSSIDITVSLFQIALPFFSLHQQTDRQLTLTTRCDRETQREVKQALLTLFGDAQPLTLVQVPMERVWQGKWIQYTSDLVHESTLE